MAEVTLYTRTGEKQGSVQLNDALFAVPATSTLIHDAVRAQETNGRTVYAHTKDRSEVAGTGKKPWKQKGTGRARHGSRRSPIWVGGGVTFGPNAFRNFFLKINKKARRKALAMALTDKVANDALLVVESFELDANKTKSVGALKQALPVVGKSVLFVTSKDDVAVRLGAKNLEKTATLFSQSLNVRDVLKYDTIIVSKKSLDELTAMYAN